MKTLKLFSAICLMLIITSACDESQIIPGTGLTDEVFNMDAKKGAKVKQKALKVTGSVDLTWKGGDKGSDKGNKPGDLLTFLDIYAHEGTDQEDPKGEIMYTVLETDYSLHREIIANVLDVFIDAEGKKARVIAVVISDSKGCGGNGSSGHDDSCGGSSDDPSSHDGGCSDDHTDEGGCSDDTHTDEGGCSDDTHTDDGGCSDDTHTDEGGCSGSDTGSDSHGGSPGGADKGNPMSGKNCRTGQIIALKTHDGGSPGRSNDGIHWKWFALGDEPDINNFFEWKKLCKKEIIGGNIVVHVK